MQKKRAELFLAERCKAAVIRREERLWSRICAKTVSGPAAWEKRFVQNVMEKTYRHGWKGRVCSCEVIGGSFYAPCEQDDRKYELRIRSQSLTREQILAVGRYLKLPVLEVKKRLDEGRLPAKELYLGPAVSTKELLEEKGISCELYPVPPYGRYRVCRRKME